MKRPKYLPIHKRELVDVENDPGIKKRMLLNGTFCENLGSLNYNL
jgi:hypothetical protein